MSGKREEKGWRGERRGGRDVSSKNEVSFDVLFTLAASWMCVAFTTFGLLSVSRERMRESKS